MQRELPSGAHALHEAAGMCTAGTNRLITFKSKELQHLAQQRWQISIMDLQDF